MPVFPNVISVFWNSHGADQAGRWCYAYRPRSAFRFATRMTCFWRLDRNDPYPAFLLDRQWNLLRANRAGAWFAGYLADGPPMQPDPVQPVNLADAFMCPGPMRRIVRNWEETARYFLHAVRKDYLADGTPETGALLDRLLDYPGARALYETPDTPPTSDVGLTFYTDDGTAKLRVFTSLAALGTPFTVAAQEIRIEYFFPGDKVTEQVFLSLDLSAG